MDPELQRDVVGGLALLVLGGVLTTIIVRFRSRLTTLRYYVSHSFFGSTLTDPHLGTVEVKFGDSKVESLWYSTVHISNDTSHDLTSIELNVACDDASLLLTSRAVVTGSLNDLPLTERFLKLAYDEKGQFLPLAYRRRDFLVPVLNRGQRIEIYFLTTNSHGTQPVVTVGCDHPGVRLKFAVAKPMLLGEPQQESALLGSLVALALCWPLIQLVENKTAAVFLACFMGLVAQLLGISARKMVRMALRLIG